MDKQEFENVLARVSDGYFKLREGVERFGDAVELLSVSKIFDQERHAGDDQDRAIESIVKALETCKTELDRINREFERIKWVV